MTLTIIAIVLIVLLGLVSSGVGMVQQYQRGVVLRFGRLLPGVREPGLRLLIPGVDRMRKIPIHTIVLDVPTQGTITRDNVTIGVDAVVYFRVSDPVKAAINVHDYMHATSQVAQTSLRSVIGRADLDTLLSDRDQINSELRAVIDAPTEDWGVSIDRVETKEISLPEGMRRSMSRQAEAERDRRARVIAADGEYQASARLSDAAETMSSTSGALQLRLLQTMNEVAADKNSTLVLPFPVEFLRFLDPTGGGSSGGHDESARGSDPAPRPDTEPAPDSATRNGTAALDDSAAPVGLTDGERAAIEASTGGHTGAGTGTDTAGTEDQNTGPASADGSRR